MKMVEEYNKGEHLWLMLLDGRIQLDGTVVPVFTDQFHEGNIPGIGMMIDGGVGTTSEIIGQASAPLPEDHPYHDELKPDEKFVQERIKVMQKPMTTTLIIWAVDRDSRQRIHNQMIDILQMACDFNYSCCVKFNRLDNKCSQTGNQCDALNEPKNRYSIQGKCPFLDVKDKNDPNFRGPETWMNKLGIFFNMQSVRKEDMTEDLASTPELYRCDQLIDGYSIEIRSVKVHPICKVEILEE
jgi:hypothetical protein